MGNGNARKVRAGDADGVEGRSCRMEEYTRRVRNMMEGLGCLE